MNYSQLAHMKRLLSSEPRNDFDPFRLSMPGRLFGMDVIKSQDVPRYQMPEWLVMPTDKHDGVRWNPAFRAGINSWSLSFLGTTNLVPRGMAYVIGSRSIVMRPEDVVKISNLV